MAGLKTGLSKYRKCHIIQENNEDELLNHPNYLEELFLVWSEQLSNSVCYPTTNATNWEASIISTV